MAIKSESEKLVRISQPGYIYSCGYYTQNCWVDDDRLILSRRQGKHCVESVNKAELILVDLKQKTETILYSEQGKGISHIVKGNMLYFVENGNTLCSLNVDTCERKTIFVCETEIVQPHITSDGRYISWFDTEGKTPEQTCRRIDLDTGNVEIMIKIGFLPPFKVANHFMICPTDPDKVFFAHEGDTTYISNRLWMLRKGKVPYNFAKQRLDHNGNLIDCFGHECWAPDGKGVYFVKYDISPSKPTGIGYVDLSSRMPKILYSKYKYWHVCAAPNGKYLAADIGPNDLDENDLGNSGVCLIDIDKNSEKIVAKVKNTRSHPGHPHPQFNPSCSRICFNNAIDRDTLSVEIIDI